MTWNVIAVLPHGASVDALYPIPSPKAPFVVREADDGEALTFPVHAVRIQRCENDQWREHASVVFPNELGTPQPQLILTSSRMLFVHHKLGLTRRGQAMVGHIRNQWVLGVAVRPFSLGLSKNFASIRVTVGDATDGKLTPVRLEVDLIGRAKAVELGQQLLSQVVRERLPHIAPTAYGYSQLLAASTYRFVGTPKNYEEIMVLAGAAAVSVPRSTALASPAVATPVDTHPLVETRSVWDPPSMAAPPDHPPTSADAITVPRVVRPAKWHPDPTLRHELRYWDGAAWTVHVSDAGATAIDTI